MKDKSNNDKKEYEFIHEIVDNKTKRDWHFIWRFVLLMIEGGVIIGIAASLTAIYLLPYLSNNKAEKGTSIAIPQDESVKSTDKDAQSGIPPNMGNDAAIKHVEEITQKYMVTITARDSKKKWPDEQPAIISGMIINCEADVIVITDYETIKEADKLTVEFSNGKSCMASLHEKDELLGIAALYIDSSEIDKETSKYIKAASFANTSEIAYGTDIFVIGNPFGKDKYISTGNITSVKNEVSIVDGRYQMVTTDVSTTEKMNGIITNYSGKVMGIVLSNLKVNSMNGIVSGITISDVKPYLKKIANAIKPAYLGISGEDINDDVAASVDKKMPYGVYVKNAVKDSPAYTAGIMSGDIIVAIADKTIKSMRDVKTALNKCQSGDKVTIKVMRRGRNEYKSIEYNIVV